MEGMTMVQNFMGMLSLAAMLGLAPATALGAPVAPARPLQAAVANVPGSRLVPAVASAPAGQAPAHRRQAASSLPDSARAVLRPVAPVLKSAGSPVDPILLDAADRERIDRLLSPLAMRPAGAAGKAPADIRPADKAAPWDEDHLLANATSMNDEYVSLAVSPLTGDLWASFAATDLGGTDRDIHLARSSDGGATWDVWEMPSLSADEYHPDLAVDAAGYLHVVWIAAPGTIMRARSAAPDNAVNWAFVEGLAADEPLATPSLAVSGGGDFARVFIALAWSTVNWDEYAYEWTLLFMHSFDGGRNVTYDYFLPDGYPDYWPDVTMDGSLVHFVNAEADYYTGELEVLIASDQYNGSFLDVASLTGWTPNNCGFPRLAGQDEQVFVVYQHDWSDGVNTDGDIIYTYSWDAGATWYGPIEMIADPYESVGPTVFTRDGVVGCLWLDAPAGADEFELASRLGSGGGHSSLFGNVEIVTDQPRVEPQFHAIAGVAAAERIHAAWIDRRDYPTQGHNVYTSARDVLPDLAPFQPEGWSAALVTAAERGGRTDGWLAAGDTTFVSFAFMNAGLADATGPFSVRLDVDGLPAAAWTVEDLGTATWTLVEDHPLVLSAGAHTLGLRLDSLQQVTEADETDNTIERTFTWIDGNPVARAVPERLVITLDPAPAGLDVDALVQNPPLLAWQGAAGLSTELSAAMDKALDSERLRVVVVPRERLDATALASLLAETTAPVRRDAVLDAARLQTDRSLAALQPRLAALARAGSAGEARPLWLSGMIAVELTPLGIARLLEEPGVAHLWLDDTMSRTFGPPAGAGERATAAVTRAWHLDRIGAPEAWALGLDGTGVLVGHVDTGIAYDHPDLAGAMWDGGAAWPHHGWDAIDEDDDPYDGDVDWYHGTHTAGLIAGDGTAGTATGSAPGATLMALRSVPGYYDDLVEGLQFGLDNGAQLFSLSGGWTGASEGIRVANRYNADVLLASGIPWICAAGNGDNYGGHLAVPNDVSSPGDCPNPYYHPNGGATAVITIGALTITNEVWDGSSIGPVRWDYDNPYSTADYHDYPWTPGLIKPDVAAPGDALTSTVGSSGYVEYSGTSMATPLVAGAAAILLQAAPGLSPADLARVLDESAVDITVSPAALGRDNYTGQGRVDIPAAVDLLAEAGPAASLAVVNDGPLPLVISGVYDNAPWLGITAPASPILPGEQVVLPVFVDPAGLLPGAHEATILIVSNDPASPLLVPVVLDYGSGLSGAEDPVPAAPAGRLTAAPNPFNPRTVISWEARGGLPAELVIFDLKGRRVRTLVTGVLPPGAGRAAWDGCDDRGRTLPSGPYFARLSEGGRAAAVRKLMLVR
jgi:subtilisin family serine protease